MVTTERGGNVYPEANADMDLISDFSAEHLYMAYIYL